MRREDLADADCGIAQTLGLIGDWWTWLILRDIAGGSLRFEQLQAGLGISRRALAERLAGLVEHGVLQKRPYSAKPVRYDYVLTHRGQGLLPALIALQEFGDRHLLGDGSVTALPGRPESHRLLALVGTPMPSVNLTSHHGDLVSVGGTGPWRVLYCFPGAWPPQTEGYPPGWAGIPGATGCTLESATYADRYEDFTHLGCEVYGVSTQRPDQLAAFAEYAALPFSLLSDQNSELASALRLPTFRVAGLDRLKRQSLLIAPDGIIVAVQSPITDPAGSIEDMLNKLEAHRAGPT